ncbi:Ig-like domain-containing protein [Enterobacter cancerogenus]|uniref:Ig-like domain-containing protein n=1 Tax=Enterobacter cancerogenus TaxID=69218 RepID=UPI00187D2CA5|nr:inverse autotransporter beta domain-containing protein [Enterobacter cancerogenus]
MVINNRFPTSMFRKVFLTSAVNIFFLFHGEVVAGIPESNVDTDIVDNDSSVAGLLIQTGQRLAGQSAQSVVSDIAVQGIGDGLSDWLNQYGSARIDLSTDSAFSIKNSSADVLLPLYEVDENIFFSQFGLHNNQNQFTTNTGLGQRWLMNEWMLGYNVFYDLGWKNTRQRYGLGVEVWRDFLKFSANSYRAISGWRESRQHENYDERPANGWDIRAEGWVPAWPWVGGHVVYERYQGEEVALTSFSQRGKNPSASTLGLNYTPIPLLTLGVNRKQQISRRAEASFTLNLNWQFDRPFSKQLNADDVVFNRLLTVSRLDPVARNNTIVMDYRKSSLLSVRFPAEIRAPELSEYTFIPDVNSRNRIARIELDDAALIAAGGKVISTSVQAITLQLPSAEKRTAVTLSGTLVDIKGNRSNTAQTRIYPLAGDTQLALVVDHLQAEADGIDQLTFTETILGPDGKPEVGRTVDWKTDFGELTVQATVTDAHGNAQARLRSTSPGSAQVSATAGGKTLAAPRVEFVSRAAMNIVLEADKETAPASGNSQDAITFTARLTRRDGTPAPGETVTWSTDAGMLSAQTSLTNDQGIATVSLGANLPGIAHVSVTASGGETARHQVEFVEQQSGLFTIAADKLQASADGKDNIIYTATLLNPEGKPEESIPVHWKTDFGELTVQATVTDAHGNAQARLRSTSPGSAQVSATAGGKTLAAPRVEFVSRAAMNIVLEADKETAPASGNSQDAITFTARLTRRDGTPAPGETVTWSTDAGMLSAQTSLTNDQGIATVSLGANLPGIAHVSVTASGGETARHQVEFVEQQSGLFTIAADKLQASADGKDNIIYTATLLNPEGKPEESIPVHWKTDFGELTVQATVTDAHGNAQARLRSTSPGSAQVSATAGGKTLAAPRVEFVSRAAMNIVLEADKETAPASGNSQDAITFTARLTRRDGTPAPGETVTWSADAGFLSAYSTITNSEGITSVSLTANSSGPARVISTISGGGEAQHKVYFYEQLVLFLQGNSECVLTDSPDGLEMILFVYDKNLEPLKGVPAIWATNIGILSAHKTVTDVNGMSYVRLKSHVSGPARVNVNAKGNITSFGLKFVDPEDNDCQRKRSEARTLR